MRSGRRPRQVGTGYATWVAAFVSAALWVGGCPSQNASDQSAAGEPTGTNEPSGSGSRSADGFVVAPSTKLVDGNGCSVSEVGTDSLTLTVQDGEPAPQAGEVLTGFGPDGRAFLRRVTSVGPAAGGSVVVQTEQASLCEAIQEGDLSIPIDFADGKTTSAAQGLIGRVSLAHTVISGSSDVDARLTDGHVQFEPTIDIGMKFRDGRLTEARLLATGELSVMLDGLLEVEGSLAVAGKLSKEKELPFKLEHRFLVMAGWVPIEGVVALSFIVGVEGQTTGHATLSAGFDSTATLTTGARFADGAWQSVWDPEADFNLHGPTWTAAADIGARLFVKPKIAVRFYEVAGPFIALKGYVGGRVSLAPSCPWDAHVGVLGEFGGEIKILDNVLASAYLITPALEHTLKSGMLCPLVDTDGDGTADASDGCPNDPNKTSPGNCGCGVAETPTCGEPTSVDGDGDGVPDDQDGCPDDAGKTAPGVCGCGVPDTDSDGDGTPNCTDGCPNDPNKTAPGNCGCGVAETPGCGGGAGPAVVKLLPSDGAGYARFGAAAVSGDAIVVGAWGHSENGPSSGAAYIFRRSGAGWVQQAKLLPSDGTSDDWFGASVAISGNTAVVGAPMWDEHFDYGPCGAVYVFMYDGSSWTQQAKLVPVDGTPYDRFFGSAVAMDGDTIVVGTGCNAATYSNTGAVHIFRYDGAEWDREARLVSPGGSTTEDWFGQHVAISGGTLVVGATHDKDNGSEAGAAYVFCRSGSSWAQQAKLLPADGAKWDGFGVTVSVSGGVIVAGAPGNDDSGSSSGSAYVFRRTGVVWTQQVKLVAADSAALDVFGTSVSVVGDTVVVGAARDDDNGGESGSAYVFHYDGASWTQWRKLLPPDGGPGDCFGWPVSISADTVVVGAIGDDDNGTDSGSAYVFDLGE